MRISKLNLKSRSPATVWANKYTVDHLLALIAAFPSLYPLVAERTHHILFFCTASLFPQNPSPRPGGILNRGVK